MDPTLGLLVLGVGAFALAAGALQALQERRERSLAAKLEQLSTVVGPAALQVTPGGVAGRFRGRAARVSARKADLGVHVKLSLAVEHGGPMRIRRVGRVGQLVQSLGVEGAETDPRFAFEGDRRKIQGAHQVERERLARALEALFDAMAVEEIVAANGVIAAESFDATALARSLEPSTVEAALEALSEVAQAYERKAIAVRALGGESRFAWTGGEGRRARCPYCHGELSGDEPDLVACRECRTVHHRGCFEENGSCTILGCAGVELEKPRPTRTA